MWFLSESKLMDALPSMQSVVRRKSTQVMTNDEQNIVLHARNAT